MIKQIYQPIINALNYEKSIIDEIAKSGVTQYNISHLFDFSSDITATFLGDRYITEEISSIPTMETRFDYHVNESLYESLSLSADLQAAQIVTTEINSVPTLEVNFDYQINESISESLNLTADLDVVGGIEYNISYLLNFSSDIATAFTYGIDTSITEIPNLTADLDAAAQYNISHLFNVSSSVEAEFAYGMEITKDISETVSMDKTRVHYVYDGGIVLQL